MSSDCVCRTEADPLERGLVAVQSAAGRGAMVARELFVGELIGGSLVVGSRSVAAHAPESKARGNGEEEKPFLVAKRPNPGPSIVDA